MAVMHVPPPADHSGAWCAGDVCVVTASDHVVSDEVFLNDCPDWLNLRSGISGIWWRGRFAPLPENQP